MKHYKLFGRSLQQGIVKVAYSDILVEILGIIVHALALSPYAKDIDFKEIINILGNQTDIPINDLFPNIPTEDTKVNVTSICSYINNNGSNLDSGFNLCVFEVSIGSAGILLHLVELVLVYLVLKAGKEKNADKSKLWLKITAVLTIVDTLIFIGSLFLKPDKKVITYMIVNIIYKCYSCGLVSAYVTEEKKYNAELLPGTSRRNSNPSPGQEGQESSRHNGTGTSIQKY